MQLDGLNIIAGDGAMLRVIDANGEVQFEATLSVGAGDLSEYQPLTALGKVELINVMVTAQPSGRAVRMSYGEGQNDSGANPDWKPQFSEEERIARLVDIVTDRKMKVNEDKKMREAGRIERRRDREAADREEAERSAAEEAAQLLEQTREAEQNGLLESTDERDAGAKRSAGTAQEADA